MTIYDFAHVSVRVCPERAEVLAQHPPDVGPHDTAAAIHVEVRHFHQLLEGEDPRLRHVPQDILRPANGVVPQFTYFYILVVGNDPTDLIGHDLRRLLLYNKLRNTSAANYILLTA